MTNISRYPTWKATRFLDTTIAYILLGTWVLIVLGIVWTKQLTQLRAIATNPTHMHNCPGMHMGEFVQKHAAWIPQKEYLLLDFGIYLICIPVYAVKPSRWSLHALYTLLFNMLSCKSTFIGVNKNATNIFGMCHDKWRLIGYILLNVQVCMFSLLCPG